MGSEGTPGSGEVFSREPGLVSRPPWWRGHQGRHQRPPVQLRGRNQTAWRRGSGAGHHGHPDPGPSSAGQREPARERVGGQEGAGHVLRCSKERFAPRRNPGRPLQGGHGTGSKMDTENAPVLMGWHHCLVSSRGHRGRGEAGPTPGWPRAGDKREVGRVGGAAESRPPENGLSFPSVLGTRGPSRPVSPQRREPGGGHGDNLHPSGTSLHSWTASAASRPSLQLGAPGGHYPELPPRTCVGSAAGGGSPEV